MGIKTILGCFRDLEDQLKGGKRVKVGMGLDSYFTLAPGEVLIFIARTGVGKTAWALNVVDSMVERGYHVLFFSLEMAGAQIMRRLAQLYYGMESYIIEAGISEEGEEYLREFFDAYGGQIDVDDSNTLNVGEVSRRVEMINPDVVVIDYLQYLSGFGEEGYNKVSAVVKGIKAMAKQHGVPVILLSQTSRAGGEGDVPLTLGSARDTGVVEETADYLVGAWRIPGGNIRASILKNRHGALGRLEYYFNAPLMRFCFNNGIQL